jgi:hypothetical protein
MTVDGAQVIEHVRQLWGRRVPRGFFVDDCRGRHGKIRRSELRLLGSSIGYVAPAVCLSGVVANRGGLASVWSTVLGLTALAPATTSSSWAVIR